MSGATRCVFISVPHGTSAGNMLRAGGLLERLQEFDRTLQIVLLSPMARDAAFVREFERPGVRIIDQPAHVPAGLEARLLSLVQAGFLSRGRTESVRIRMMEARANGIIRWLPLKALLGRMVTTVGFGSGSPYALSDRFVSHPDMERLFDEHQPALVVCANPGLVFSEVPLMRTARRRGVPCMVIDASWDNFTNKLLPVRQADRLVVWNELMKTQAVTLHGYRPDAVRVAGAPQFDVHFKAQLRATREEFFQRIGADPSRKLIVVTTTPRALYRHHDHVLRVLAQAIEHGPLGGAQVLVRLHPRDDIGAYREFAGVAHVIIGYDFYFGHKRAGNPQLMETTGKELGFGVTVVAPVAEAGEVFSSSAVRVYLAQGDVKGATHVLGEHWRVQGKVIGGAKRGTGLGFPTANVPMPKGTALAHGIYAVRAHVDGKHYDAAAYLGTRPTFDNGMPVLEVFIFDFQGDLYGHDLDVEFVDFVRADRKFSSGEELVAQMDEDVKAIRAMLLQG